MTALDVIYCEGWDPAARRLVGQLPLAVARDRDESGEQYAVLLTAGDAPRFLVEVCWRYNVATAWSFDEHGRRTGKQQYRKLDDSRLLLFEVEQWAYRTAESAEFDYTGGRRTERARSDGTLLISEIVRVSRGISADTSIAEWTERDRVGPMPAFGDWNVLLRVDGSVTLTVRPDPEPYLPVDERPWQPPIPKQPAGLARLFTPGESIEVEPRGPVRLPTGRLVAADPGFLADQEPFAQAVPPGEYPVLVSLDGGRAQAAKVVLLDEPVAHWELALRPGESVLDLGDDEFYGFPVDSGRGCFCDAAGIAALADAAADADDGEVPTDAATGTNVVLFTTVNGDGAYPTWIGRTSDGRIACFVADLSD